MPSSAIDELIRFSNDLLRPFRSSRQMSHLVPFHMLSQSLPASFLLKSEPLAIGLFRAGREECVADVTESFPPESQGSLHHAPNSGLSDLDRMLRLPSLPSSTRATSPVWTSPRNLSVEAAAEQIPWLFVGLGNPGSGFVGTRHNVGFEMIDAIAEAEGIRLSASQHKSVLGNGCINGTPVLLAKPQTYMNLSGEAVGPMAAYYRIPVEKVLVMYDDMDLAFAVMRLLPKGGHGGHNGMKSIINHFKGSRDFPRLRIGVGKPSGLSDTKAYVLQKFAPEEREELLLSFQRGIDAVRLITSAGLEKAVSTWNENRRAVQASMKQMTGPQ